jgi:3-oxoadipate enol-lactonase
MPHAQVGDIRMNYTVQGEGEWLVMVGGYASGNWSAWGAQLERAARDFKVLAFDNRGIGATDAPDMPYSTEMLAADALGLMAHLGIERAHVLGKSLGGAIAQQMALQQPQRVRSLAMTSTFGKLGQRGQDMVRWWMGSARAMGLDRCFMAGLLTYFYSESYYEANRQKIDASIDTLMQVNRPLHGYLSTGQALLTHDVMSRLGQITCPTQILIGKNDIITTVEHSQALAAAIAGAQLQVYEDTWHGFMSERPEAFESMLQFFKQH